MSYPAAFGFIGKAGLDNIPFFHGPARFKKSLLTWMVFGGTMVASVFSFLIMDEKGGVPWWQPGMLIFARLSGWIGGPVLVAVFVGKWLDKKYNTEPWLFLLSVGIAFAISMFGIVRDALREMKRIEREEQNKKSKG